mgnify:CR=1 FL=1
MKVVFQHTKNKSKHKIKFFSINEQPGEVLCFSSLETLNNKENLDYIKNFSIEDSSSLCHKLDEFEKNDVFAIASDRDGMNPNIHTITDNKKNIKFFFNCTRVAPSDFIDRMLKLKKKQKVSEFSIKDNNLAIFLLPGADIPNCKSKFSKKEIGNFSKNFNNFIDDRIKKEKLLKFKVPNGKYVINTYWYYDVFGDYETSGFDVVGHLIELKK